MEKMRRFRDRLKEDLKNPEFKEAFDEEEVFASIAIALAKLRAKRGLTQRDLAKKMHTSQQMVSRLEDTDDKSYSLRTLAKAAHVLGKQLVVKFV